MILLEHLNEGVFRQAVFANAGEICGFPTRSVQILFDLRRHIRDSILGLGWIEGRV